VHDLNQRILLKKGPFKGALHVLR